MAREGGECLSKRTAEDVFSRKGICSLRQLRGPHAEPEQSTRCACAISRAGCRRSELISAGRGAIRCGATDRLAGNGYFEEGSVPYERTLASWLVLERMRADAGVAEGRCNRRPV